LKNATAEQQALLFTGMSSIQGQDIQLIEWMKQQGMVDAKLYTEYQNAVKTADKTGQEATASQIFRDSNYFGSIQDARAAMRDPGFRLGIGQDMKVDAWIATYETLNMAMEREMPERVREVQARRSSDLIGQLQRHAGIRMPRNGEADKARVEAMAGAVLNSGGSQAQAALLKEQFGTQGMAGVRALMGTDEYAAYRGAAEVEGQEAYNNATLNYLNAHGGRDASMLRAKLDRLQLLRGDNMTPEQQRAATEARRLIDAGDIEAAKDLSSRVLAAGLTDGQFNSVVSAGAEAGKRYDQLSDKISAGPDQKLAEIEAGARSHVSGEALEYQQKSRKLMHDLREEVKELAPKLSEARELQSKYYANFEQNIWDYAGGRRGITILDLVGIRKPDELTDTQLANLTNEERTAYGLATNKYKTLQNAVQDLTPSTFLEMSDEDIDKKFGVYAEKVKTLQTHAKDPNSAVGQLFGAKKSDAEPGITTGTDTVLDTDVLNTPRTAPDSGADISTSPPVKRTEPESKKPGSDGDVTHPEQRTTMALSGQVTIVGLQGQGGLVTIDVGNATGVIS
jgi:hypothetical protein